MADTYSHALDVILVHAGRTEAVSLNLASRIVSGEMYSMPALISEYITIVLRLDIGIAPVLDGLGSSAAVLFLLTEVVQNCAQVHNRISNAL